MSEPANSMWMHRITYDGGDPTEWRMGKAPAYIKDGNNRVEECLFAPTSPSPISADAVKPVAAYTVDLTGCEHISRDIAGIERIAAAGANGETKVMYLYDAPRPTVAADAVVEEGAKLIAVWIGYAWDGLGDRDISAEYSDWRYNTQGGMLLQGGKPALRKLAAAILALKGTFPSAPEAKSEVAVKALEWEEYPNPKFAGPDIAVAYSEIMGRHKYQVQKDPWAADFIAFLSPEYGTEFWKRGGFPTLETAKSAAQADYETRLRSALVDPEGGV